MRGAHKNRHIVKRFWPNSACATLQSLGLLANPARLFLAVPMADQTNFLALLDFGPKFLAKPVLIASNHTCRRRQNMRCRAIVLLQTHHGCAGKVFLKAQDIAHFRAAPAIDRLVIIAHTADVFVPTRKQTQPKILRYVGVLILVHQHIFKPALIEREHIVMLLKNTHHMQKQIAKIRCIQLSQAGLILRIKLRPHPVICTAFRRGQVFRKPCTVLPPVNDTRQHPRGPPLVINPCRLHKLLKKAQLVIGVQNGEIALEAHKLGMTAQNFHTNRVKRPKPRHPLHRLPKQACNPLFHFSCSLIGKGHSQYLVGLRTPRIEQMHNPRGQSLGLARARSRQHQNRPVQLLHSRTLRRVEVVQIRRAPCHQGFFRERYHRFAPSLLARYRPHPYQICPPSQRDVRLVFCNRPKILFFLSLNILGGPRDLFHGFMSGLGATHSDAPTRSRCNPSGQDAPPCAQYGHGPTLKIPRP